ncbi:MAG: hypothetical protein Aurels2KO_35590 [Aureliella sp.]
MSIVHVCEQPIDDYLRHVQMLLEHFSGKRYAEVRHTDDTFEVDGELGENFSTRWAPNGISKGRDFGGTRH